MGFKAHCSHYKSILLSSSRTQASSKIPTPDPQSFSEQLTQSDISPTMIACVLTMFMNNQNNLGLIKHASSSFVWSPFQRAVQHCWSWLMGSPFNVSRNTSVNLLITLSFVVGLSYSETTDRRRCVCVLELSATHRCGLLKFKTMDGNLATPLLILLTILFRRVIIWVMNENNISGFAWTEDRAHHHPHLKLNSRRDRIIHMVRWCYHKHNRQDLEEFIFTFHM